MRGRGIGLGRRRGSRLAISRSTSRRRLRTSKNQRRLFGLHRYDRAQGFNPAVRRLRGSSMGDLLDPACEVMGGRWSREWFSNDAEGWQAPPAYWFQWGVRR